MGDRANVVEVASVVVGAIDKSQADAEKRKKHSRVNQFLEFLELNSILSFIFIHLYLRLVK